MHVHYRVNAGLIPLNHWTQDPEVGGGRIIGEGCHFIDFITYLVGAAQTEDDDYQLNAITANLGLTRA